MWRELFLYADGTRDRCGRRGFERAYLLIRRELRGAQHVHAKLFRSRTAWPTGYARWVSDRARNWVVRAAFTHDLCRRETSAPDRAPPGRRKRRTMVDRVTQLWDVELDENCGPEYERWHRFDIERAEYRKEKRRRCKRGATRGLPRGSPILVLLSPKHA